jgi:hypothetical protein
MLLAVWVDNNTKAPLGTEAGTAVIFCKALLETEINAMRNLSFL